MIAGIIVEENHPMGRDEHFALVFAAKNVSILSAFIIKSQRYVFRMVDDSNSIESRSERGDRTQIQWTLTVHLGREEDHPDSALD